jgi:hypothetical protein
VIDTYQTVFVFPGTGPAGNRGKQNNGMTLFLQEKCGREEEKDAEEGT